MKKEDYNFFQNRSCRYFPCHPTAQPEHFNCLFCFCPLYTLGDGCGGNFRILSNDIKDCSECTLPHSEQGYAYITDRFEEIRQAEKKNRSGDPT